MQGGNCSKVKGEEKGTVKSGPLQITSMPPERRRRGMDDKKIIFLLKVETFTGIKTNKVEAEGRTVIERNNSGKVVISY
jgi:hypothetical protein